MNLSQNRALWETRIQDFKSANLSQKTWCQKHQVTVSALRYWLRKLSLENQLSLNKDSSLSQFLSISLPKEPSYHLTIEVKGLLLSFSQDLDERFLLKLLSALQKL